MVKVKKANLPVGEKNKRVKGDWASLVAQMARNLPAMQESQVQSLGWEDLLEKGMATHSSILAWRIPTDRGAWQAIGHGGHKELDMTEAAEPSP